MKPRIPCFVAALAIALLSIHPLPAQAPPAAMPADAPADAPPAATPEETIRQTLEAMRAHDFAALAKRTDPAGLAELRRKMRPLVAADSRHEISKMLFGVESLEAFDALSDGGFFVAFMTQLSSLGSGTSSDARFAVLGSVAETADLVHVVYRASFTGDGGGAATTLNLMSVRRQGGEWKADLTDNLNTMTERVFKLLESAIPQP